MQSHVLFHAYCRGYATQHFGAVKHVRGAVRTGVERMRNASLFGVVLGCEEAQKSNTGEVVFIKVRIIN